MNRKLMVMAFLTLLLVISYGTYRLGVNAGARSISGNGAGGAPPAAMPAGAPEDPSAWTPAQREDATRRHISEGIGAGDIDPVTGREVLHYYDPMLPANKFAVPGKSPFMDMMLVPAYAGVDEAAGTVGVDARLQQNLGMRVAEVVRGALASEVRAVGTVAWNAREEAVVQARTAGFVEQLHVRATLDRVAAGQPLVELYVPEWRAIQEEFLALARMEATDLEPLLAATRVRMRQAGMSPEQIAAVEAGGQVQTTVVFASPVNGIVTELGVREGAAVLPGELLFRLNGTQTVWAYADVPESQAALLVEGGEASVTSPSLPGLTVTGNIQSMLAQVDPGLRTRRARIELPNPEGKLAAGMLLQIHFRFAGRDDVLLVPSEALIRTGTRTVVMLAEADGAFRPQEVTVGIEANGRAEILEGLQAGQRVVLSGQFLLDSEASLAGLEARVNENSTAMAPAVHRTRARIEEVGADTVTLSHPPIATLNWPAMTMGFALPVERTQLPELDPGTEVEVEFYLRDNGEPEIMRIEALEAAP